MTRLLLLAIQIYRNTLGIMALHSCRFWPTCSHYADMSLRQHGWLQGSRLAMRRLLRCHPWGGHGIDLPPPA